MKSTGRFTDGLRLLMAQSYDRCKNCGSQLPREVAAFAGYAADGSPLYVGACCEQLIAELATHVYWWWVVDKRCEPRRGYGAIWISPSSSRCWSNAQSISPEPTC
jgi:hypothetical protein